MYKALYDFPLREGYFNTVENGHWKNEYYMRNEAFEILQIIAQGSDKIIISDLDEIIHKEAILEYDSSKYKYANTEMFLYYFYYNQLSVFKDVYGHINNNYWYNGIKITTLQNLSDDFSGSLSKIKSSGCNMDLSSRQVYLNAKGDMSTISCKSQLIRKAGWHFTYILNDEGLFNKLKGSADCDGSEPIIKSYNNLRSKYIAPNSFYQYINVQLDEGYLPNILSENDCKLFKEYVLEYPTSKYYDGYTLPPSITIEQRSQLFSDILRPLSSILKEEFLHFDIDDLLDSYY